jgi:hypothetical protein
VQSSEHKVQGQCAKEVQGGVANVGCKVSAKEVGVEYAGRHERSACEVGCEAKSWQIANARHEVSNGVAQVVGEARAEVSGGVVHTKSTAEKT